MDKAQENNPIHKFVRDQLSVWPLACNNFRALKKVETRTMMINGLKVSIQFNPARIVSSAAKLDAESLKQRKCFLCHENRPPEQASMLFEGRKGKKYEILVNPYPIFSDHLVIAFAKHQEQSIWKRYVDMLDLARKYNGYSFFYNGPKCGASAPDHHHFQACRSEVMPLEIDINRELDILNSNPGNAREAAEGTIFDYMTAVQDAKLYHYNRFAKGIFVIKARTSKSAAKMLYRFLDTIPTPEGDKEPRFNLIVRYIKGEFRTIIMLRKQHRSHHYFSEGEDHLTMSPGCADMGGYFIAPIREDYEKLTPELLSEMIAEVTPSESEESEIVWRLSRKQPTVSVGVLAAKEIEFEIISDGAGVQKATYSEGKIMYNGALYDELTFEAQTLSTMFAEPTFILKNVKIGIDFHWERTEDQMFAGSLKIIVEDNHLTAVNVVGVEDYLLSVISSEMKSTASEEFLKAHAVISRSWVLSRILNRRQNEVKNIPFDAKSGPDLITYIDSLNMTADRPYNTDDERIEYVKWYDHDDHKKFDVCADDHCQRYQGLTRAVGDTVRKVIDTTWGEALVYDGALCDARFSKCCGGVTEKFSTCWEDEDKPYLVSKADAINGAVAQINDESINLSIVNNNQPNGQSKIDQSDDKSTINQSVKVFCDTKDDAVLSQVLNDYDLETKDFYRWTVKYTKEELSELIEAKTGCHIGEILAMTALERGGSGRISKLEIKGSEKTLVVGKELEIRRILSKTHLKSSAFDVTMTDDEVILEGRGWGHGVGLCQIGAAVMASKGYNYHEILNHYYPGANILRIDKKKYK